jgi:hypothetical protein
MFTKSARLNNILIKFYNFTGIMCIKAKNNQFKVSNFIAVKNLLMCSIIMTCVLICSFNDDIEREIYDEEVSEMPMLSDFSNNMIKFTTISLITENFLIVFIHAFKRKKITSFLEKINKTQPLTSTFAARYEKICLRNLVFQITFQVLLIIPELLTFSRQDRPITWIIFIIFDYYYIPNIVFINFAYNFKKFVLTLMQQSRARLEGSLVNEKSVIDSLNELLFTAEIVKEFHSIFGLQLTLIAVENTILVVLGVSIPILICF